MATTCRSALDGIQEFGHANRAAYLTRRVFLKRQEVLSHNLYSGNERPDLFAPPLSIRRRFILVTLPGILPEIGNNRNVGGLSVPVKRFPLMVLKLIFQAL